MKNVFCLPAAYLISLCVALNGCTPALTQGHGPISFESGLKAIEAKNFSAAAYHFAELAKTGDPAAMNNLGVALLMVQRNDEAVYWFEKATRYGDPNAANTLRQMSLQVPPADLVGRHGQSLIDQKNSEWGRIIIEAAVVGLLLGVTYKTAQYSARQNYISVPHGNEPALAGTPVQSKFAEYKAKPLSAPKSSLSGATQNVTSASGSIQQPHSDQTLTRPQVITASHNPPEVYRVNPRLTSGCRDDTECNGGRCNKTPTGSFGVCMDVIKDFKRVEVKPRPATTGLYTGPKSTGLLGDKGQCENDNGCPPGSRCSPVMKICMEQ